MYADLGQIENPNYFNWIETKHSNRRQAIKILENIFGKEKIYQYRGVPKKPKCLKVAARKSDQSFTTRCLNSCPQLGQHSVRFLSTKNSK